MIEKNEISNMDVDTEGEELIEVNEMLNNAQNHVEASADIADSNTAEHIENMTKTSQDLLGILSKRKSEIQKAIIDLLNTQRSEAQEVDNEYSEKVGEIKTETKGKMVDWIKDKFLKVRSGVKAGIEMTPEIAELVSSLDIRKNDQEPDTVKDTLLNTLAFAGDLNKVGIEKGVIETDTDENKPKKFFAGINKYLNENPGMVDLVKEVGTRIINSRK